MLAADRGPGHLRRCRHGHPARSAAAPRRRAGRPRRRARVADPARRLRHADQPAALPAGARACLPRARFGLGGRTGPGHPVRVQGLHPRGRARPLPGASGSRSIVFDVELIYLARRRGYRIAIVPVHWTDRRGSRMRPRPGLALTRRLGPLPDPVPPPRRPSGAARPDARRLNVALVRAALPILAIGIFGLTTVAILATAHGTWGYDYQAYAQRRPAAPRRPAALRPECRCRRRVRDLPVSAAVRARLRAVRAAWRPGRAVGLDRVADRRAWSPRSRSCRCRHRFAG